MQREEVEIVPGVMGPRAFLSTPSVDPQTGHQIEMVVRFDDQLRRYTCDELTVKRDGERLPVMPEGSLEEGVRPLPITADTMRNLKPGETIEALISISLNMAEPGKGVYELPNPDEREPWGLTMPDGLALRGPTDRVLRWVAHFYRYHFALGEQPTDALVRRMNVSRATAGRWVSAARDRSYLGLAIPGKAGEAG